MGNLFRIHRTTIISPYNLLLLRILHTSFSTTKSTLHLLLSPPLQLLALYYQHHYNPSPVITNTTATLHPLLLPPSALCYHHHCHPSHVATTTTVTLHTLLPSPLPPPHVATHCHSPTVANTLCY